jgi:hypothetical protein
VACSVQQPLYFRSKNKHLYNKEKRTQELEKKVRQIGIVRTGEPKLNNNEDDSAHHRNLSEIPSWN